MDIDGSSGCRNRCALPCWLCALNLEDACPTPKGGIHAHAEPGGGNRGTRFTRPRGGGCEGQLSLSCSVCLPAAALAAGVWGGWCQAGHSLLAAEASCTSALLTVVTTPLQDG